MTKVAHKKHYEGLGWEPDAITKDWQDLVDRRADGEGSGVTQRFYVCESKKRIRDRVRYVENEMEDASKAVKDMQQAEHEELQNFVKNSDTAFNHEFLSMPSSSSEVPKSEAPKPSDTSPDHVPEISREAPKVFEKQNQLMDKIIPSMQAAKNNVASALQQATDNPDSEDRVRQYHVNTVLDRQKLLKIWLAESFQDVEDTHSKETEPLEAAKPTQETPKSPRDAATPKSPSRAKKSGSTEDSGEGGDGAKSPSASPKKEPLFPVCLFVTQYVCM